MSSGTSGSPAQQQEVRQGYGPLSSNSILGGGGGSDGGDANIGLLTPQVTTAPAEVTGVTSQASSQTTQNGFGPLYDSSVVSEAEAALTVTPLTGQTPAASSTEEYGPPAGDSVVSDVPLQDGDSQNFLEPAPTSGGGGQDEFSFENVLSGNQQTEAQPLSFENVLSGNQQSDAQPLSLESVISGDQQSDVQPLSFESVLSGNQQADAQPLSFENIISGNQQADAQPLSFESVLSGNSVEESFTGRPDSYEDNFVAGQQTEDAGQIEPLDFSSIFIQAEEEQ